MWCHSLSPIWHSRGGTAAYVQCSMVCLGLYARPKLELQVWGHMLSPAVDWPHMPAYSGPWAPANQVVQGQKFNGRGAVATLNCHRTQCHSNYWHRSPITTFLHLGIPISAYNAYTNFYQLVWGKQAQIICKKVQYIYMYIHIIYMIFMYNVHTHYFYYLRDICTFQLFYPAI